MGFLLSDNFFYSAIDYVLPQKKRLAAVTVWYGQFNKKKGKFIYIIFKNNQFSFNLKKKLYFFKEYN